jgi:hypothetical protein
MHSVLHYAGRAALMGGLLAVLWHGTPSRGRAQELPATPTLPGRVAALLAPTLPAGQGPAAAQPPAPPAAIEATPAPGVGPLPEGATPSSLPDGAWPCGDAKEADPQSANPWAKIPPVRPMPPFGNFPVFPTGPGYYSLLDVLTGNYRQTAPKYPYGRASLKFDSLYESDFRYLEDPKNTQHDIFDVLHRIHLGDNWLFNTGGEFRIRYADETNSRGTGKGNNYDLSRVRVYGDLWYRDTFRVYVEYIDADVLHESLAPLPTDINRGDLLNAFVDAKLFTYNDHNAYVRVGRQELLLGSQRLISPLDWANTRRTFEGVRAFRQGEKFDFDLFWVSPVVPNPTRFDSEDDKQNFAGAWMTYRPKKGDYLDFYWLFLDNANKINTLTLPFGPYNVHTLGTRYFGKKNNWLWDVEPMLQLGDRGSKDIIAGAATVGGGYNFSKLPWNPTWWVYYDYASGTSNPNSPNGSFSTFNQLFPFGHYYLGFMDLIGRQNIHDVNSHLWLFPTKWITFWLQYHHLQLDQPRDALYNSAGVPYRRDPTGRSGTDVGDELTAVVNFHLSAHSDIFVGYGQLWAGSFFKNTGPPTNPSLTFVQYSFRW